MPKGVPASGFRMTKNRMKSGFVPGYQQKSPLLINKNNSNPVAQQQFAPEIPDETDEQVAARINQRFDVMRLMAELTATGRNRALIISGPAGLGKTFGVQKIMEEAKDKGIVFEMISGFVRPTGLYKTLYDNRFRHCVVVFDDADSIFFDDVSLNLLKKACDTTSTRRLHWLAETHMSDEEGERLPRDFEFEGAIIFITNYDFDAMVQKGHKLAEHLQAMISRSHYLDLSIKSRRDYLVRIQQVIDAGMLKEHGYDAITEFKVRKYIETNVDKLRELSLRMVLKLATLTTINSNWQKVADVTCLRQ